MARHEDVFNDNADYRSLIATANQVTVNCPAMAPEFNRVIRQMAASLGVADCPVGEDDVPVNTAEDAEIEKLKEEITALKNQLEKMTKAPEVSVTTTASSSKPKTGAKPKA